MRPDIVGKVVQIAGRDIPGRVLRLTSPRAMRAPVLPALIQASASCSDTALTAKPIEEDCLVRITAEGLS